MRTFFETSWQRDRWSPRMGQAVAPSATPSVAAPWWSQLFTSAAGIATGYFGSEAEEERRRAEDIKKQTELLRQQAQFQAGAAPEKVFGVSPTTALLVGGLGIAAVIGVVMLVKSK